MNQHTAAINSAAAIIEAAQNNPENTIKGVVDQLKAVPGLDEAIDDDFHNMIDGHVVSNPYGPLGNSYSLYTSETLAIAAAYLGVKEYYLTDRDGDEYLLHSGDNNGDMTVCVYEDEDGDKSYYASSSTGCNDGAWVEFKHGFDLYNDDFVCVWSEGREEFVMRQYLDD